MRKRILFIVFALCMMALLQPSAASAANYVDSGACGKNLTWTLDNKGTLTISGTGDMEDYDAEISGNDEGHWAPWLESSHDIKKVVIKGSVAGIGSGAFYNCTNLKSIRIPNSVKRIGEAAFYRCSSLKSVVLPNRVTSISCVFMFCSSLENINIPDSVTDISGAFQYCSALESINLPDSITKIADSTFLGCSSLTSIRLSGSVTSIGYGAFSGCRNLKSISIPDSVTSIGQKAFEYCSSLKDVNISAKVPRIEDGTFFYCNSLMHISLPDGVTSIGCDAFTGCSSLKSIGIPDSVTSIEFFAFSGCSNLRDIYYGGSESDWESMYKGPRGNSSLFEAAVHYNNACAHSYRTSITPATMKNNGSVMEMCDKCGNVKNKTVIYAAKSITLSKASYTYNGKVQKPSVIVKDSKGKLLKKNTDYTLSYPSRIKNAGRYIVTVTLKGHYSGTASRTFDIVPKGTSISKVTAKKKKLTVKWKKQENQATGYEIAYSTSSKFAKKSTKIMVAEKSKTTSKTASGLKAGKKYYVRIRTYKKCSVNGKSIRLYSKWSKAKAVVAKMSSSTKAQSVTATKLSAENKRARKAYGVILEDELYRRAADRKVEYALIDLDNNGIDELFVNVVGNCSADYYNAVYAFKDGAAKLLVDIPFVQFQVYTDGTFSDCYGHTGYVEEKYYRVKDGSLITLLETEGHIESSKTGKDYTKWYLKKIGDKDVSYVACRKWIEKFQASHKEMKLPYKDNTSSNRASMLEKR